MAVTTSFALIRNQLRTRIEAIVPGSSSNIIFQESPNRRTLLKPWAIATPSSDKFRKFQIIRDGAVEDPPWIDPQAIERNEPATLTIAYPCLWETFGFSDLYDLEDVMRADARLIRDKITSPTGYLAGMSNAAVQIMPPDREDSECWFQDFVLTITYTELQTLD